MLEGQTISPNAEPEGLMNRLIGFGRFLRLNGFMATTGDIIDLSAVMDEFVLKSSLRFKQHLQVVFCSTHHEVIRFEELFNAFWLGQHSKKKRTETQTALAREKQIEISRDQDTQGKGGLALYYEVTGQKKANIENDDNESTMAGASISERSTLIDFDKTKNSMEQDALLLMSERLGRQMRYRLSRRYKQSPKGKKINFRRTFRTNINTDGIPFKLVKKKTKTPPIKLVNFIDVSGSMDNYSLFFTRFMHALTGGFQHSESFLFHTRLAHISTALSQSNAIKMMEKLKLISGGWSGGTRIADSLKIFNDKFARKYVDSKTIIIIMSDGYDSSGTTLMADQLKRLKSRCYKVIWLNPMMGRKGYEVKTDALKYSLPYIDILAPAYNLRTLLELEKTLVKI
tara:strand:+ start:7815 stop:9011 length:1197 start_codon:yes stop_codon:yes gene_type:complete